MSGTRNYIPMRRPALFPRQTFRLQTSETDGFEPSRPSLRPGRSQLLAHSVNPDSRVSKVFNVSCLPLDCFHPCQSHGVVSEDYS
nr:MAG TPA: hypothetical protein [Caudoviricetes sp.]